MQNLKYSIVEAKKADLDSLDHQVQFAEYKVTELQAVVASLELKSSEFTGFLAEAETSKETALSNLNLLEATLSNVKDFARNAAIGNQQADVANTKIATTSTEVSQLVDQLIYSGEIINKFAQLVFKKKLLNPLISDELVKTVTTANADVNQAIASTLTALQSCFASSGVIGEANSLCGLQQKQAEQLLNLMSSGVSQDGLLNIADLHTLLENTDDPYSIFSDAMSAESESYNELQKKPKVNKKQFDDAIECHRELHQIRTQKQGLLYIAKDELEDEKRIQELEAEHKNADSAVKSNHKKCQSAHAKLLTHYEASHEEIVSIEIAQNELAECCRDLKEVSQALNDIDLIKASLKEEFNIEKKRVGRSEYGLLELKWRMLAEMDIHQIFKIREVNLNAKRESIEHQLKAAYERFEEAESGLTLANTKLMNGAAQAVGSKSILALLTQGYATAVEHYRHALKANQLATKELDQAKASLDTATHHLSSLQAGLSAANAAAFAA